MLDNNFALYRAFRKFTRPCNEKDRDNLYFVEKEPFKLVLGPEEENNTDFLNSFVDSRDFINLVWYLLKFNNQKELNEAFKKEVQKLIDNEDLEMPSSSVELSNILLEIILHHTSFPDEIDKNETIDSFIKKLHNGYYFSKDFVFETKNEQNFKVITKNGYVTFNFSYNNEERVFDLLDPEIYKASLIYRKKVLEKEKKEILEKIPKLFS